MATKIQIIILMIILFIFPLVVSAEGTGNVLDKATEKYDRQQKQGEKVIDSSQKDINAQIEKEIKAVDLQGNNDTAAPDEALDKLSKGTYKLTGKLLFAVQGNSFPICLLGVIAGAMIFFILGPRNIVRRRYGAMLMFGFLSIWVVAQVAPVIFLLMI